MPGEHSPSRAIITVWSHVNLITWITSKVKDLHCICGKCVANCLHNIYVLFNVDITLQGHRHVYDIGEANSIKKGKEETKIFFVFPKSKNISPDPSIFYHRHRRIIFFAYFIHISYNNHTWGRCYNMNKYQRDSYDCTCTLFFDSSA